MSGTLIKEAYFLGIKQYGYYYTDELGNRIEKSVFSGVPKNMIAFQEIIDLHNNKTVNKIIPLRFFRSFKNLSITIKNDVKVTLKRGNDKLLIDNIYKPLENVIPNMKLNLYDKIRNSILKFFKIYIK